MSCDVDPCGSDATRSAIGHSEREVHELVEEQSAQLHRAPHLELQWDQFHQDLFGAGREGREEVGN